jgi:hypothetical protein
MIFSENRYPLFRIMLWRCVPAAAERFSETAVALQPAPQAIGRLRAWQTLAP